MSAETQGLCIFFEKVRLYRFAVKDPPDLFPADTFFLIQTGKLTDGRYDPLTRPPSCPDRLDQRPVAIGFPIDLLVVSPQIHVENIICN